MAVATLALLPCLVVLICYADNVLDSIWRAIRRGRRRVVAHMVPEPDGPPLEQIAADLHRLGLARRNTADGSVRHGAATRAYDRRLNHACRALDIEQHLSELTDLDLDLERLRVEGALLRAGFVLVAVETELDV